MCPIIGPTLRNSRLRRGLTLQDAAHKTRISVPRLKALEQDDFASFGNSVYARSFLKLYSEFLQVDATQTLEWLYFNPPQPASARTGKKVTVTAGVTPPVHVGYDLWDGRTKEQRKAQSGRAPSPVPATVATFLILFAGVGLWLHTLAQDWRSGQVQRYPSQPALLQQTDPTFAYRFRTRPPGRPEPKQIVADAAATSTASPVSRAN